MSDESVVVNDITRYGLRRVQVVRMGARVCREAWIEQVPGEGREFLQVWERYESEVDVWHLWLWWNAREMVDLTPRPPSLTLKERGQEGKGEKNLAGFWWLGGMPVRLGVDCAATMFRMAMGRWPGVALVRDLPVGASEFVDVTDVGGHAGPPVRLCAAGWVPGKFVVVMDAAPEGDGGVL